MTFDERVLGAMLRLARRREAADDEQVALRVGGMASDVRAAMRRLRACGLVETRLGRSARLTLQGLAVAVALLPARGARRARPAASSSRAA